MRGVREDVAPTSPDGRVQFDVQVPFQALIVKARGSERLRPESSQVDSVRLPSPSLIVMLPASKAKRAVVS